MMSDEVEKLVYTNKLLAEACTSHRKRIADLEYALGLILCLNEDAETMTGHERDERATAILENSNG